MKTTKTLPFRVGLIELCDINAPDNKGEGSKVLP